MAGEPLDTLEIKISSTSDTAVKHVEALAASLERLDKASQIEGLENIVKKLQALGNVNQTISVTVDSSSVQAVDSLIERVGVLQRAIEQVNATPIRVSGLSSRTATTRANTAQSASNAEAFDTSAIEVESQAVDKVTSRVAALRRSISGIGEGITRYMNSPLVAGASLWTAIGSKATSAFSNIQKIAGETSLKIRNVFSSAGASVNNAFQSAANTIKNSLAPASEYVSGKLSQLGASAQSAFAKIKESKAAQAAFRTLSQPVALLAGTLRTVIPGAISVAQSVFEKLASVIERVKSAVGGLSGIFKGLLSIVTSVGKIALNVVGSLWSGFKRLASTIAGSLVSGIKKFGSLVKTIGSHVLNYVTKPFQRAIGFIESFKKKLVSVAFYRLVRTALKMITDGFKEGIENLYYFSSLTESQFKPAMDSLASSSLYLKNSLGAMAAPLIQAVAPAVNYLIDLFVSLLNVINMVFSVLGGRTYTKALKTSAKYADDLDKSLGGGASSAKELQRYLIGIDQLTIMPDEPNRGGGGGGGLDLGSQYEEMFEEVPLPDWVLNIKDAINQGDWTGAGELLAEKVNSLIDKLKDNAKTWGRNIGQAIQRGIELSLGFIRKVDIEGVGESITTLIGNALDNINPHDLGAIIATGIKSAFRFAHGLLQGYTGPEIGTYLANVVNGWFAELRSNKGWAKAGEDLNKIILSIINGVSSFIEGLNTDSVEKDLKDFFGKIDWDGIWSSLERLAQIAAEKIPWKDMLNSLWRFAANVLVFLRSSVLGIPSNQARQPWKDLEAKLSSASETINWADIISGLIAFVGDLTSTIKGAIPAGGWGEIWASIKESLSGALGFDSWEDLSGEFKDKVFSVVTTALDAAADAVYGWLTGSGSLLGDLAANVFFPDRYQVDKATQNFIGYLKAGSLEAAQAQINAMVSNGTLTASEAARIAAEHGYSYANGLLSSLPDVNGAAETISNTVNSSLGKIDNDVEVVVNATKTPAFDAAVEQISETNDKAATLSATVNNTNTSSSDAVQNTWSSVDDKTATLKTVVKETNTKSLENIRSAWSEIDNKNVKLNATVVDAMSSTRTRMLDAWDKLKTKSVTLTARASNPNESTFSTLLSTWKSLVNKTVTLTAKGTVNDSVNTAKNAINGATNKSVTLNIYGALTNSFNDAKRAYDSLTNKTVSVTVNGRSSGTAKRETGGIFSGGSWHNIAGYAGGGNPKRARLFYANENGIPELVGRIGSNTAVMNNGQIVASVSSGVYRAVSAAMGGIGSYFANIATGMSHIPDALRDITPVSPQPITLERDMSVYQQMEAGGYNRYTSDSVSAREQESTEHIINAIMAMGRQIITAINENGGDFYLDGQAVGTRTTEIQNRQSRIYGKAVATT